MRENNYGKLSVEEIIVNNLDRLRDMWVYRYLDSEGKKSWRIYIVRKIMRIRKRTSRIMTILDFCIYCLIGSAAYQVITGKKNSHEIL